MTVARTSHWKRGFGNRQFFSVAVMVLGLLGRAANAQTNEWTWIAGSNTLPVCTSNFPNCGLSGVYGTLQTPASGNTPGGRAGAASWTDSKGNLWLFSGFGYDSQGTVGYPNDLWQFNPTTHLWAWMGGSNSLSSGTKASGANPGQLGVYGTLRTPATGNIPGSRSNAFTWTDAGGNFWLFGGDGYDSAGGFGYLNDLWEFNPITNQWAWMGGSTTVPVNFLGQPGIYGTLGTPAPGNMPGGRVGGVSWTDGQGNLWLAGGVGAPSNDNDNILNDVWEFNPSSNEWAWMAGVSTVLFNVTGEPGVYGTLGVFAAGNLPGGREGAVSWTDSSGHVWLFGGDGDDSANTYGWLNDLWQFQPTSNQWAWMAGSETISAGELFPGQGGVYGTLQVPAAQNTPGGRYHSVSWTDKQGNLWLFGGWGYDSVTSNFYGDLNDLWEFQPSIGEWAWMTGSETFPSSEGPHPGQYGTLGTAAFGDTPGGRASAISWTDSTGKFWLFGGTGYDSAGNYGLLNDLWQFQPPSTGLRPAATPVISPGTGTYISEQTVTITDTTPGATISYLVNGNTPAIPYTAPIVVSASETIEASAVAPGYTNSSVATAVYTVNLPLAALPVFSVAGGTYATTQTLTITDTTPGAAIYYIIGEQFEDASSEVPSTSSTLYTGPITIAASQTVTAIAVAAGYANSNVASATYSIWPNPALGEWTWMSGSNTSAPCSSEQLNCGQPGEYGTLGTPADTNVPGARSAAATWTDKAGNLWLFGGSGFDSAGTFADLNDLWNFNTSTNQWTWMGGNSTVSSPTFGFSGVYGTLGKPAAGNLPGSRYSADSWTDGSGNFWLFGGFGFDSAGNTGYLNDLWMFNPSTRQWTWASGSSIVGTVCNQSVVCASPPTYGSLGVPSATNIPGGRISSVTWVDKSGDLWLFGGNGTDSQQDIGDLGDLWEFSPATSEWTWVDGGTTLLNFDNPGTFYGIQGVAGPLGVFAPANIPAGRTASMGWSDPMGNFWLFGGYGVDEFGFHGALNDLWEFKTSTGEWAWMGGYLSFSTLGFSGIEGTLAAANLPGALYGATGVTDSIGNFWLFGGFGLPPDGIISSDALWEFNTSTSEWGWMNGVNNGGLTVYGTLRIPADTNTPGARFANSWADQKGNIWIFGGNNTAGSRGYLNDLWKYVAVTPAAEPAFSPVAGTYTAAQTVTITDTTPNATIYFTTDGSTPTTSSTVYSSPITVSSTETLNAIATASGYSTSPIASALYTIDLPPPHPNFSITGPAVTVTPGATAGNTSAITLTPSGGFTGTISLTCAITPAAASDPATCDIPASVTISGTAVQTATLTVNTTAASSALNGLGRSFRPLVGGTALAYVLLIGTPARRRRWCSTLGVLVLLFYIVGGALSCSGGGNGGEGGGGAGGGGGGGNAGTTAGSYVITVTGTSGDITQTGTVSLAVK